MDRVDTKSQTKKQKDETGSVLNQQHTYLKLLGLHSADLLASQHQRHGVLRERREKEAERERCE